MYERTGNKNGRQTILETAVGLIHRNGFRSTGINDILAGAGLTKGAFYHHFKSKNDMGYAIIDEFLHTSLIELIITPIERFNDPIEGIRGLFSTLEIDENFINLGCPINNLAVEMASVDDGFRGRIKALYGLWIDRIAAALRGGQKHGYINKSLDVDMAAAFIVASIAGCRSVAKSYHDAGFFRQCTGPFFDYLETLRPRGPKKR